MLHSSDKENIYYSEMQQIKLTQKVDFGMEFVSMSNSGENPHFFEDNCV